MFNRYCLVVGCVGLLFMTGCAENKAILSQDAEVKSLSAHDVSVNTYRLPKGAFRGFYWEFKKDHAFRIWIITNEGKDIDVYIPVPNEFLKYREIETTEDWDFKWDESKDGKSVNYLISHKEKKISLEIKLPFEKGKHFGIDVLTNSLGENMVVFGNGSDYLIHKNDKGIFGYAIVKERK
jgi:hypothetical protein